MTATEPVIDGPLAATLRLTGFRATKQRPEQVWIRGRRASSRRVIAILETNGSLTLHRPSRIPHSDIITDVADHIDDVTPRLRQLLAR